MNRSIFKVVYIHSELHVSSLNHVVIFRDIKYKG